MSVLRCNFMHIDFATKVADCERSELVLGGRIFRDFLLSAYTLEVHKASRLHFSIQILEQKSMSQQTSSVSRSYANKHSLTLPTLLIQLIDFLVGILCCVLLVILLLFKFTCSNMTGYQPNHPGGAAVQYRRGIFDSRGDWEPYLQSNPLFTQYILPNVDIHHFLRTDDHPCPPSIAAWFSAMMIGRFRPWISDDMSEAVSLTVAIGEIMGPALPNEVCRDTVSARVVLANLLRTAFGFTNFPNQQVPDPYALTNQQYVAIPSAVPFTVGNLTS
ncbi:hypothetical protein J6590_008783 [Homalodisca vitripennis]|nr:hypothetical protein J6590_008783 [Homalodisca vitripennis]